MRRLILSFLLLGILGAGGSAIALSPGTEVFVPAGLRGTGSSGQWITNLYIQNPNTENASITVYIYERDQPDSLPASPESFELLPDETLVLEDVVWNTFSLESLACAFRITSNVPVTVNGVMLNSTGGEYGQGFEGVPDLASQGLNDVAYTVGIKNNAQYSTRIFMMETGGATASATLDLLDIDGNVIATAQETLGIFESTLPRLTDLFPGNNNLANATLRITVTNGLLVAGASRVSPTGDPLTLAASSESSGASSSDGTYQIAIYDSAFFAAGGNFVIDSGIVTQINATYFNWDKLEGGDPACTLQFLWGLGMSPTPLADFASGVTFSDSYTSTGSGVMEWTVTFTVENNIVLDGTVAAVGSDFTEPDELGCNGVFPTLPLKGGKTE